MATDNIFAGTITCTGLTCTSLTATAAVSFSGTVSFTGASTTITGLRTISESATAITAARVLKASDSGGIFTVNQGAAYQVTLPTPTGAGLRFVLQLVGPANNAVTVIATGCTFEGTLVNDVTSVLPATGNTFTFVANVAALGDNIEFISTSTTKYFARAVSSNTAGGGITIT